jgi:uncharacterized tellurite resistance protein B-like protein
MGRLKRATTATPMKQSNDDALLLHAMLLMAGVDGSIDPGELSTVQSVFDTLPEFRGKDFDDLLVEANRIVARFGGLQASVAALADLSGPVARRKCFVLAVDVALASGDVDDAEDALLDRMQKILDIDDAFADRVIEVLETKYRA